MVYRVIGMLMTDIKDDIRNRVAIIAKLQHGNDSWMRNTIILENGTHLGLEDKSPMDTETDTLITELFDLVGDDAELRKFMFDETNVHSDAVDYKTMREEALGWKPGMVVGTPDVPQETVDEYIGVSFHCENGCTD